jgi:glucosylceramidase
MQFSQAIIKKIGILLLVTLVATSCNTAKMNVEIYETSRAGKLFENVGAQENKLTDVVIEINPVEEFQTISGIGGSFTESTCYLLNKLSEANRRKILEAYFSEEGANYSLTRTHMASCDFSLSNYTYAPVENDTMLAHLIPIIKQAQKISKSGFNIIASPWTAPPWMKDNKHYVGGKLLPQYNAVFAHYYTKYFEAYKKEGIDIWAITVMNEPHGNGNNWESTLFSPKEMTDFVEFHLGPTLEKAGWGHIKILGYDQNRAGIKEWVDEMYRNETSSKYYAGTAVHWYESTYDYFGEALDYGHSKRKDKHLIQTEGCVDSEVPHWNDDDWYWQKEATDWGWDWASEAEKHLHPKYAPVHRYATDIIGCLNHGVDGWVDWNMVLDKQGGPNWFKNWCVAPVIVDQEKDDVYFTPLYYIMKHFSKYIRPEAKRIAWKMDDEDIMCTALENKDGSIVVVLFNTTLSTKNVSIKLNGKTITTTLDKEAIQTIVIH